MHAHAGQSKCSSQPARNRIVQTDLATVQTCKVPDNWQSQTRSGDLVIQTFADPEDAIQRFCREPGPIVFDRDYHLRLAFMSEAMNGDRVGCPLTRVIY